MKNLLAICAFLCSFVLSFYWVGTLPNLFFDDAEKCFRGTDTREEVILENGTWLGSFKDFGGHCEELRVLSESHSFRYSTRTGFSPVFFGGLRAGQPIITGLALLFGILGLICIVISPDSLKGGLIMYSVGIVCAGVVVFLLSVILPWNFGLMIALSVQLVTGVALLARSRVWFRVVPTGLK